MLIRAFIVDVLTVKNNNLHRLVWVLISELQNKLMSFGPKQHPDGLNVKDSNSNFSL